MHPALDKYNSDGTLNTAGNYGWGPANLKYGNPLGDAQLVPALGNPVDLQTPSQKLPGAWTVNRAATDPWLNAKSNSGYDIIYTFTPKADDAKAKNYLVGTLKKQFDVTKRALTINIAGTVANNRFYGDANPAYSPTDMTFAGADGFATGESASTLGLVFTVWKTTGTPSIATPTSTYDERSVGSIYRATAYGSNEGNYAITRNDVNFRIVRAVLGITVNNRTKQYGDALNQADIDSAVVVTGIKNADAISKSASCSATASSPLGDYAIVPNISSTDGSLINYTYTVVSGTLTVTRAPLTITARSTSRRYGKPNPTFTAIYSGFKLSDSASVLTSPVVYSCAATETSPIGSTWDIIPSGAAAGNYSITYPTPYGKLSITVNHAPTAGDDSMTRVAGDVVKIVKSKLLLNDFDSDNDALFIQSVSATTANGGSVTTTGGGLWLQYNPVSLLNNDPDSFTYVVSDGDLTATGTVFVNVTKGQDYQESQNLVKAWIENGLIHLRFIGLPGKTYIVSTSPTLISPDWRPRASIVADSVTGLFEWTDPVVDGSGFYRALPVP